MRRFLLIAGLLVVVVAVVVVFAASRNSPSSTSHSVSSAPTQKPAAASSDSPSPSSTASPSNPPVIVTYDGSTFSPNAITVKAGQSLVFTNKSSRVVDVDSDPHPQHTSDPELNVGDIQPGQGKSVVVHKTGTFGIHNHLNPSQIGSITVQ